MSKKPKLPNFNVFVFSLPRCGSSMMTGIIERLGVNMVYTSEDKDKRAKMKKQYKKTLGEYVPNEHFYEIVDNQFANWMKIMETPYAGCKVIIPVNDMRWEAVCHQPAKVIMMMRDPEEIRQSQEAFYSRKTDIAYLRTAIVTEQLKLEQRRDMYRNGTLPCEGCWNAGGLDIELGTGCAPMGLSCNECPIKKCGFTKSKTAKKIPMFDFMQVEYQAVLADPKKEIKKIAEFIEAPNRITRAVNSVKPDRNRFKKENITEGI